MTIIKACFTVFLLAAGATSADQNDPRLDELFVTIGTTENVDVASRTENEIWQIWVQHKNQRTQDRLAEGIDAMNGNPRKALQIFNELIEQDPDFAEGWNKRATLYYLFGEYAASARDIERTLELEPRHFGALSGLGLVYLAQNEYINAESAFKAVLLIHPHSVGVRKNIELINDYIRRSAI